MKNEYNFIFETTTVVPFNEIEIINESKTNKGQPKIAYKCRLQESDIKNSNRRIYSQAICESIVNQLAPKANSRSLLMEIDHPMFFSGATDPMKAKQRAGLVEINNCGAILRGLEFRNGQIIGEMETLSGLICRPLY